MDQMLTLVRSVCHISSVNIHLTFSWVFSGNDTVQYASNAAKFPRHFNSILQVVGGVAVPGRLYSTVDGAPAANPTAPSRPTSTIINDIITFLRITHL